MLEGAVVGLEPLQHRRHLRPPRVVNGAVAHPPRLGLGNVVYAVAKTKPRHVVDLPLRIRGPAGRVREASTQKKGRGAVATGFQLAYRRQGTTKKRVVFTHNDVVHAFADDLFPDADVRRKNGELRAVPMRVLRKALPFLAKIHDGAGP